MDGSEGVDLNIQTKSVVETKQGDCLNSGVETVADLNEMAQNDRECDKTESPKQEVDAHILQHAIQKLYSDPSFAVICSFFNKFAIFLGLKPQCFAKMESMFTSFHLTGKVDRDLIDLHLTLMRKLTFKSARLEVWEKYLLKFCSLIPSLETEYLQLERYGYLHTTAATKLTILKALCESQFDFNVKFKESLFNSCTASDLRLLPIGYDKEGLAYLYQQDADLVIRIYSAEQDDHSGGSWNLVAKCKEDLEILVTELKNRLASKYLSNLLKHHEDSSSQTAAETNEQINVSSAFITKRGALLDTYQDESAIKQKKLVKPSQMKKKAAAEEESKKENSAPPMEIMEDIPDDVKPFLDRRILPRRSARSAAINQLKELTAPLKPQSGKRKNPQNKKQMELENAKQLKNLDKDNNQNDSEDNNENEKDEDDADDFILAETSTSSDDEFMPLSELKKRNQNSRRRRGRRAVVEKDPFEMVESEEDEDSDDVQEKKTKKERKKATEETLCMKCSKSSNPEVLLLCDLCDEAWHTWCLHPILWYVPDDDWFCPNCQQAMLIEKFSEVLVVLAEQVKRKAAEDKKKEAAAERLKREMEYIGVSLNNIIDTVRDAKVENSESSEESNENDGERKSKKKAIKRLGVHPQKPIVPIALSRSRRHVAKVDYKFGAYDELIQEAVKNIDESAARQMSPANIRPKGGAGRGKDISNIINAENKRFPTNLEGSCEDRGFEGHVKLQTKVGKSAKSRHRLNDLNVDEMTESDTDEYQASESASVSDPSDDTDEYVPSDTSRGRRTTKRLYSNKRTQSDDDFVVSGSESEYEPSRKKSHRSKNAKKTKGKRKRERWSSDEDSTSEPSDNYESEESNSSGEKRTRRRPATKWAPPASSSDGEDSDHSIQKTAAGRPLRKAVAKRPSLTVDNDDDEEGEEDEEEMKEKLKVVRPVGTGRKTESSDEFEPDDDDDEEEEEEEVEDEVETADDEEMEDEEEISRDDDQQKQGSERKVKEKMRKVVEVENGTKITKEVIFSAAKDLSTEGYKQTKDVVDVFPSTSSDFMDKTVQKVKTESVEQELFYAESTKMEDVKKEVKMAEKVVVANVEAANSNITSCVLPSCFPSTSADLSSLNPSSVMQQMARLASSSAAPVQQFDPPNTVYQNMLQTTAPTFIGNGAPLHIYSGPVPVTVYQVRQPTFIRTPGGMIQSTIGPLSQGWAPYPPQSSFPTNAVAPTVVVTTTTPSTTDSETLGNVLASAMDY